VNNRQVHLSREDAGKLFGPSHELTLETPDKLLWPGQTLWKEKVAISGPGGSIQNVGLVGPYGTTSIELSCGDAYRLGLRMESAGAKKFPPGVTVKGPSGSVFVSTDSSVSGRWLLVSKSRAEKHGLKEGAMVDVRAGSGTDSAVTLHNVKVVVSTWTDQDCWPVYLDSDAAGAASVKTGDTAHIILD
jgi:putative phosphotransacetylase